jgi:hypothetical protein
MNVYVEYLCKRTHNKASGTGERFNRLESIISLYESQLHSCIPAMKGWDLQLNI